VWHTPNTTVTIFKRNERGTLQTRPGVWNSPRVMSVTLSKHDKKCGTLYKHDKECGTFQTPPGVWHTLNTTVKRVPHFVSCVDTTRLVVFEVSHSLRLESATLFVVFGECPTHYVWRVPHSVWCLESATLFVVFGYCHCRV
jgi:hypothetical protein